MPRHTLRPAGLVVAAWLLAGAAHAEVLQAQAVRNADGLVELSWTESAGRPVDVLVGEHPSADAGAMTVVSTADADGRHSYAPTSSWSRPYFLLRSADGATLRVAERVVPLEGAMNFRDVGGYATEDGRRVRWGAIFRSAALSGLTEADAARIRALDVDYVYDLRSVGERRDEPTRWPDSKATLVSKDYEMDISAFLAVFADGPTAEKARAAMTSFYPAVADSHRDQFRAVFTELLEADEGAILYHCSAGKDRTGVQTALILSALGVPRETIIQDFLLSNAHHRLSADAGPMARLPADVVAVLGGVERQYIEAFFAEVDRRYGGVEAYLDKELDVSAADIQRLRALYTE